MRTKPFEEVREKARWDGYRRMHWHMCGERYDHPGFIQFEDGSVILNKTGHDPGDRKKYLDLNVQIISTKDDEFRRWVKQLRPVQTFRGSTVELLDDWEARASWFDRPDSEKTADLKGGQQMCLIDWDTNLMVSIGTDISDDHPLVPFWVKQHRAYVYWMGAGYRPQTTGSIKTWEPTEFSPEETAQLEERYSCCKMWYEMEVNDNIRLKHLRISERQMHWSNVLKHNSWTDMHEVDRKQLALHGYSRKYIERNTRIMAIVDAEGKPYPQPNLRHYGMHKYDLA